MTALQVLRTADDGRTLRGVDPQESARTGVPDRQAVIRLHREAVLSLEKRYGQALFGFVRRNGLTDEQAADAVQDVLARLWSELAAGTAIENPRAWAYRAIYRLAMDQHRLRRRVAGLIDRLSALPGRSSAWSEDDRIAVWAEVDRLPARQRQVLYLRYRSDLSFDEIGTVLDISASAARSHATQATATLRRRLAADEGVR